MSKWNPRANEVFARALECASDEDRAAYISEVCGQDGELRATVSLLLQAHFHAGSFLSGGALGNGLGSPADTKCITSSSPSNELAHSVIGALRQSIPGIKQVTLREPLEGPITKPGSKELPELDASASGKYELHGEIARGGMGVILKGRDSDLGRDLAIKVLRDSHIENPEVVERFIEEAQIAGQLQHPGIVPVHDLGLLTNDRPFFTMKLVKGKTLATILARRNEPTQQAHLLGIFDQVCQTVAYAHSRGVIHRDLKPANIMVGAFGEVQVMDWGLAKVMADGGVADERKAREKQHDHQSILRTRRSGSDSSLGTGSTTRAGSVMGTPAYMPPEQALGEVDRLDERADVFGLGSILCEIITGSPPYVHEDLSQVLSQAKAGDLGACFRRLDQSDSDLELIEINKRALAKIRDDRWSDAGELAQRFTEYQSGVRERLRRAELESAEERARAIEERRRRRIYVAVCGLLLVVAVASGIAAQRFLMQRRELAEERNNALALLKDLRVELEEKVTVALMFGDERLAEESIARARIAGMSDDELALYRGQLALFYGRPREAMAILDPVSHRSVAALGLRCSAEFYAQDYEALIRSIAALQQKVAASRDSLSYLDKLFAGFAMINGDMITGMELVNEAKQERSTSPLAQMIHAVVLAAYAHNTGNIEPLDLAIEEINGVMRYVGAPYFVSAHHIVQEIAHTFGKDKTAGVDVDRLKQEWEKIKDLPSGRMILIRFLADLGDESVPDRIREQAGILEGEGTFYIPILLNYKTPQEVMAFAEGLRYACGELEIARLRALTGPANEAQRSCVDLIKQYNGYFERNFCLNTLLLLGKNEKVRLLATELASTSVNPTWLDADIQRFLADPSVSPEDLLECAGDVRAQQCGAHFTIAMLALAVGDDDRAQSHLKLGLETDAIHHSEYWWAKALLASLRGQVAWKIGASATRQEFSVGQGNE